MVVHIPIRSGHIKLIICFCRQFGGKWSKSIDSFYGFWWTFFGLVLILIVFFNIGFKWTNRSLLYKYSINKGFPFQLIFGLKCVVNNILHNWLGIWYRYVKSFVLLPQVCLITSANPWLNVPSFINTWIWWSVHKVEKERQSSIVSINWESVVNIPFWNAVLLSEDGKIGKMEWSLYSNVLFEYGKANYIFI